MAQKRYRVSCVIAEVDEDGEDVDGGRESNLDFEVQTSEPPTIVLKNKMCGDTRFSNFCT